MSPTGCVRRTAAYARIFASLCLDKHNIVLAIAELELTECAEIRSFKKYKYYYEYIIRLTEIYVEYVNIKYGVHERNASRDAVFCHENGGVAERCPLHATDTGDFYFPFHLPSHSFEINDRACLCAHIRALRLMLGTKMTFDFRYDFCFSFLALLSFHLPNAGNLLTMLRGAFAQGIWPHTRKN